MTEIISLHVGQCGNAIATQFWEVLCTEHGLNQVGSYSGNESAQLEKVNVFFSEVKGLHYTPRALLIDLGKPSLECVRSSPYGQIFKDRNFIFGNQKAGNNWAKGHLTEGAELCEVCFEAIRKEVEDCDHLHGFQMTHSVGGGTGGGFGSLLLQKLQDEYPCCINCTFSVVPSPKVSTRVVESYNAILTMNHLIDSTQETFLLDNEALYEIASKTTKTANSSYSDINYLITMVMSGVTSCMRFRGQSSSLRKLAVNLVPFSRLHFFIPGYAPLWNSNIRPFRKFSVAEIATELFDYRNVFAACDARQGKFLTVACIFRGQISAIEVEKQMYKIQNRDSSHFVEWIPDNIKSAIFYIPPPGTSKSATFIGNTTAIQEVLKRIRQQYLSMMRRRAFLHWYLEEGMVEDEFHSSEANLNDLIHEYHEQETNTGSTS